MQCAQQEIYKSACTTTTMLYVCIHFCSNRFTIAWNFSHKNQQSAWWVRFLLIFRKTNIVVVVLYFYCWIFPAKFLLCQQFHTMVTFVMMKIDFLAFFSLFWGKWKRISFPLCSSRASCCGCGGEKHKSELEMFYTSTTIPGILWYPGLWELSK